MCCCIACCNIRSSTSQQQGTASTFQPEQANMCTLPTRPSLEITSLPKHGIKVSFKKRDHGNQPRPDSESTGCVAHHYYSGDDIHHHTTGDKKAVPGNDRARVKSSKKLHWADNVGSSAYCQKERTTSPGYHVNNINNERDYRVIQPQNCANHSLPLCCQADIGRHIYIGGFHSMSNDGQSREEKEKKKENQSGNYMNYEDRWCDKLWSIYK